MINYTVSFEQANAHTFEVTLEIKSALSKGQKFYLPNWIPGSYMIRDFARNIITLTAYNHGNRIDLNKVDKSTWQLNEAVDCIEINYQVYAWDLSVRSAHLDNQHGFFNGTSLFLGVEGKESEKHQILLKPSSHAIKNNWLVATSMSQNKIDQQGFGEYFSPNYETFIDHPFEIGQLEKVSFEVYGVPHHMYFTEAPDQVDWQRIAKDVKKICETEVDFFGDKKPPFEHYVFMTFVQKSGFGGLEHINSTALHCSFDDLPLIGDNPEIVDIHYRTFLSLCCHEYFHNWNVKRIKPAHFIPMDLSKEIHTELLWFFEGITSYYDELLMVRSKIIEPSSYLDMLAQTLTKTLKGQGRFKQTVTESSFDAWTKFYKQDENATNGIVSYYSKGAMVALCLDFEIRRLSQQKKSLDDLMRIIWNDYGKVSRGLAEKEILGLVNNLVGKPLNDFFSKALYSTEELDLNTVFEQVGVEYQLLPPYLHNEKGGFIDQPKNRKSTSFLGITYKEHSLGAQVHSVSDHSCAQLAGISNNDIIIAINNIRVTAKELDKVIARIPIDEEVMISYFRRERLYHVPCQLLEGSDSICYLSYKKAEPSQNLLNWVFGELCQENNKQ